MSAFNKTAVKNEIVPLLFKFKQLINKSTTCYCFNDAMGVNTLEFNGSIIPEVLMPGSLSRIKTQAKDVDGAED